MEAAGLKALAHSVYVTSVEQKGETYYFTMYEKAKIQPGRIPALINEFRGDLTLKTDGERPCFIYERKGRMRKEKGVDALAVVKNVLNGMKGLIEQ